ncbi:monovalent cation/H(+) antiporter subunit G [Pararhodospirillum photometricum]|uniref:monovalent cation/H(+) antiporter subunit G n=1 Tax=Pararhodospirillum photometricum TaxID=1084 RepID=UPI0002EBB929|nr:monovalent cation/H(+) antiporter subunit G [Pararhodospirillum photometricum]
MDLLVDGASWITLVAGGVFLILGAVGVLRFPDLYTRMHAASLIDTLGAGLITVGLMLQAGPTLVAVKLALVFGFLCLTGPISTHALAGAAWNAGVRPQLDQDQTQDQPGGPLTRAAPTDPTVLG